MAKYEAAFTGGNMPSARLVIESWVDWSNAVVNRSSIHYKMYLTLASGYGSRGFNDCVGSFVLFTWEGHKVNWSANTLNYNLTAGSTQLLLEGDVEVPHRDDGTCEVWVTGSFDGKSPLGSASIGNNGYGLQRLIVVPPTPTAFTATRSSDARINLAWTNRSDVRGPYGWTQIQRWDSVTNVWSDLVAAVNGTSYADTTTVADRRYRYQIRSWNSAGASAWVTSADIYTSPNAPTGLTATKSGSNIVLTWADRSSIETGQRIEYSANGGAWTLLTNVAANATSYTHASPAVATSWRYRVRATAPGINSAWSNETAAVRLLVAPPAATSVTATRVSDAQTNISWSNSSTTHGLYSTSRVERWDNVTSAWSVLATLAGAAYSDKTTIRDRQYRYRVINSNSAGAAAPAYSGYVYTTPAAPTGVAAAKSGTQIVVTWTDASTTETGFTIQDNPGGSGWVTVGTVAAGATSFTHAAPDGAKTHQYRVIATGNGGLSATSAASATVQLLTAPNAPTPLAPVGGHVDATADVVFSWRHNPVDTTPQTAYELQYRERGASAWTTLNGTTAAAHTITGLTNGTTYEWQARTKGAHADWSPWSALQSFGTSAPPTVTITTPPTTDWVSDRLQIAWTYADAESTTQARAEVTITADGQIVDQAALSGPISSYEPAALRLANGAEYTITVRVQDGHGIWSAPAARTIRVQYREPSTPTLVTTWLGDTAAAMLSVTNPAASPTQEATASNEIWRAVHPDAIDAWRRMTALDLSDPQRAVLEAELDRLFTTSAELIASDVPVDGAITDPLPSLSVSLYRVLAVSTLGTSQWSGIVELLAPADACWNYLNAGPGNALVARWRYNPESSQGYERAKTLHHFSGRRHPVEFVGTTRNATFSIGGELEHNQPHSTNGDLMAIIDADTPAFFRDVLGRRELVSLASVQFVDVEPGLSVFSAQLTRVES